MRFAVALAPALLVTGVATLGVWRATEVPPPRSVVESPRNSEEPSLVAAAGEVRLGPGNAWDAGRAMRDVEVSFLLDPGELSVLEVRLRGPDIDRAEGIGFFIGTEPRVRLGFVRETARGFTRLGPESEALRGVVERLPVRIVARGSRFEAYVGDGAAPVVFATDGSFADGSVVLVAARGEVTLHDLEVRDLGTGMDYWEARAVGESVAGVVRTALSVLPGLLLLILVLSGRYGLGRRSDEALVHASFGLAPFAAALALPAPDGAWGELGRGALIVAGFTTTLFVGLRPRASDLTRLVVVTVAVAASWCTSVGVFGRSSDDRLDILDYEGVRLEPGFLDLESAAVRAGMPWLARHRFAGVSIEPDDVRPRVFVLGRSDGTVASRLARALGDGVAVIDGSAPDGGLLAAWILLDVAVAPHGPDVVVLTGDAAPGLDSVDPRHFEPGARRTFLDRLAEGASRDDAGARRDSRDQFVRRAEALGAAVVIAENDGTALVDAVRSLLARRDGR